MLRRDFKSSLKRPQDFPTSLSETSENVCLLIFISVILWFVSFGVCIYIHYFFDVVRNKLLELIKRRSKVQEKNMLCEHALNFDQWKTFPKFIGQWEFGYGLFKNLPKIIVACYFSPSLFKLRRGILPLLTKDVS